MTAIAVERVSKAYKVYSRPMDRLKELLSIRRKAYHSEFLALRDVSFEVQQGTIIGLLGQNGAGKSTLLQVLAGILQPTRGTVRMEGRVAALLALGAGFDPEFTGRENVFLNGSILGFARTEMEERFDLIADFAEIGEFMDQPVKTYSAGMYIRLAFAIASNVQADVLLLDEALAVGDSMFQRRCYRRLQRAKQDGRTIVLASHNMNVMQTICDVAILIDHGTVLKIGEPVPVCHAYRELIARREEAYAERLRETKGSRAYWIDDGVEGLEDLGFDRSQSVEEFRFGTRDVEILDVELLNGDGQPARVFHLGQNFSVVMTIQANADIERPNVGMVIHTPVGVKVYGINTENVGQSLGPIRAGVVMTVKFSQTMRLNVGSYILSCGVTEEGRSHIRILDKRKDLILFQVLSTTRFIGLAHMETQVSVTSPTLVS